MMEYKAKIFQLIFGGKDKVNTVAVEIKSILIPKKFIVEFEMTFFGKEIRPECFC